MSGAFHSPRYKAMCRRLREARERAGLTQAEAARALGQPQNFISKSERGERRIDPVELANFMALYRVSFETLVPPAGRWEWLGGRPRRVAEPKLKPRRRS